VRDWHARHAHNTVPSLSPSKQGGGCYCSDPCFAHDFCLAPIPVGLSMKKTKGVTVLYQKFGNIDLESCAIPGNTTEFSRYLFQFFIIFVDCLLRDLKTE
jgi:hypothetical protein